MPEFRDHDLPLVESALKKCAPAIAFSTTTGIGWEWADVVGNMISAAGFWGGAPRRTARPGEAPVPSILTLFDQPPRLAPQRLTTFDRACLCAIHRPRMQIPASRLRQTILDVYDSDCVRVGAPAG